MDNISAHISYAEATYSNTAQSQGISNDPTAEHLEAMKQLANMVFEPVRVHYNVGILINSFYRSAELNAAIGGSSSSQHCKGEAVDLDGTGTLTNAQIFHYIKDNLVWDQMIWEFGDSSNPDWVHVSYKATGTNRKELLTAYKDGSTTRYKTWVDESGGTASTTDTRDTTRTGTVTASSLYVRDAPSGNQIGSLPNGTVVTILGEDDDWYNIRTSSIEGWVSAMFVS